MPAKKKIIKPAKTYFRTNTHWPADLAEWLKKKAADGFGDDVNEVLRSLIRQARQADQSV